MSTFHVLSLALSLLSRPLLSRASDNQAPLQATASSLFASASSAASAYLAQGSNLALGSHSASPSACCTAGCPIGLCGPVVRTPVPFTTTASSTTTSPPALSEFTVDVPCCGSGCPDGACISLTDQQSQSARITAQPTPTVFPYPTPVEFCVFQPGCCYKSCCECNQATIVHELGPQETVSATNDGNHVAVIFHRNDTKGEEGTVLAAVDLDLVHSYISARFLSYLSIPPTPMASDEVAVIDGKFAIDVKSTAQVEFLAGGKNKLFKNELFHIYGDKDNKQVDVPDVIFGTKLMKNMAALRITDEFDGGAKDGVPIWFGAGTTQIPPGFKGIKLDEADVEHDEL